MHNIGSAWYEFKHANRFMTGAIYGFPPVKKAQPGNAFFRTNPHIVLGSKAYQDVYDELHTITPYQRKEAEEKTGKNKKN